MGAHPDAPQIQVMTPEPSSPVIAKYRQRAVDQALLGMLRHQAPHLNDEWAYMRAFNAFHYASLVLLLEATGCPDLESVQEVVEGLREDVCEIAAGSRELERRLMMTRERQVAAETEVTQLRAALADAAMRALESVQAQGYYFHRSDGEVASRDETVALIVRALHDATASISPSTSSNSGQKSGGRSHP